MTKTIFGMSTRRFVVGLSWALAIQALVFGVPSQSRAATTTISSVTVTVNGVPISPIWTPQTLSPGQNLVLAQDPPNQPTPQYNFDASDSNCPGGSGGGISNCPPAVISFIADGVTYTMTDKSQVLTLKNADPGCCTGNITFNEAQNYTVLGTITTLSGLSVTAYVAYADNAHLNACGSDASSVGLPGSTTCFPNPFNGSDGTTAASFFQGNAQVLPASYPPSVTVSGHNTCSTTVADCWDGGVIMFSVAQAPSCVISSSGTAIPGAAVSWNKFNTVGNHDVVWIHAHIGTPSGVSKTSTTTVTYTGVTFVLNNITYNLPDGILIFNPSAPATPSTSFDPTAGSNGTWTTVVNPNNLSDQIFFDGGAVPVDSNISGGGKATFNFTTLSSDTSLAFSWQWSAAVFTNWPVWGGVGNPNAGDNAAQIEPYHGHLEAGAPMNTTVEASLIQGPRGGGGSNFTGSWSGTGHGTCPGN